MIRIILVDDHPIVRSGLRAVLESEPDFSVEAEAEDARNILDLVQQLRPDVLILDIALPGVNGLEVTWQVHHTVPTTHIIILSIYSDESYVAQALENGASGYVLKEASSSCLIKAIRDAVSGKRYLSPPLSEEIIETYQVKKQANAGDDDEKLTAREREVLTLVVSGQTRSQIANYLGISPRTVEVHRANVRRKLGIHSQTELLKYALKHGLLPPD